MMAMVKQMAEDELRLVKARAGGVAAEFWKFAVKGNVFDLAVAVILGNALTQVVNSIVNDVGLPLLSIATGNLDDLGSFKYDLAGRVTISYGHLLQVSLNFFVIALCIFLMFKGVSTVRARIAKKEETHPETKPEPSEQEKLLMEIRDTLKSIASK